MTRALREIFLLYAREKTLRVLMLFFLACIAMTFLPSVLWRIITSPLVLAVFQSVIIMLGLWLTFLLGIILKRHLASHRASLLPGYREAHIRAFLLIFGFLVAVGLVWVWYLASYFHRGPDEQLVVVAASVFIALANIILGYVSVVWLVIVAFIAFCLCSDPAYMAVGGWIGFTPTNILTIIAAAVLLVLFTLRLGGVREEALEYPYLFTWSGRLFSAGSDRNWIVIARILQTVRGILGFRKDIQINRSYRRACGVFAKALHWDALKWENYKLILVVAAILSPIYVFYIHMVPGHFVSVLNGHLKYLFLAVYPVIIAVGLNQKSIGHWGYELTRPVGRSEFIRARGVGVLLEIGLYWLLAFVFVMVVPYSVLDPAVLVSSRFWTEIALTFTFALAVFGWIACLYNASSAKTVLSLVVLAALTVYQFFQLSLFSTAAVCSASLAWAVAGCTLCLAAYRKWTRVELT